MFYMHMAPTPPAPGSSTARGGLGDLRLPTPSRPKSAVPAIRVPTMATSLLVEAPVKGSTRHQATPPLRSTAFVGFSPRVPSAPHRPVAPATTTTPIGGNFQHVLQAHSTTASPRRTSYGGVGHDTSSGLPADDQASQTPASNSASTTTGNIYHAMTARKNAEETAKQLARRIAHYRAQEEKVLREVQLAKQRLENLLASENANGSGEDAMSPPPRSPHAAKRPISATTHASRMAQRSDVKIPRSREQLQFLTRQRRVIQYRKNEAAQRQKEKRQAALEMQRQKDAAEQSRRVAMKERIQYEQQLALEQRAVKQHQLLDVLEQQHHSRLRHEQTREMEVKQRISDMQEEEKNLVLRLQALQLHQEHIRRGLGGSSASPLPKKAFPPRPLSARPVLPTTEQLVPFADAQTE